MNRTLNSKKVYWLDGIERIKEIKGSLSKRILIQIGLRSISIERFLMFRRDLSTNCIQFQLQTTSLIPIEFLF